MPASNGLDLRHMERAEGHGAPYAMGHGADEGPPFRV